MVFTFEGADKNGQADFDDVVCGAPCVNRTFTALTRLHVHGEFDRLEPVLVHDDEGFGFGVIIGVGAGEGAERSPVHRSKPGSRVRHAAADHRVDDAR